MNTVLFVISLAVIGLLLVAVFFMFFGKSKSKTDIEEEDDGLVYDPVSGKYMTVEDMVELHQVEVVSEEMAAEVHGKLAAVNREIVTIRDVYNILDGHHQAKATMPEDQPFDDESMAEIMHQLYEKKGREIPAALILEVFILSKSTD